MQTELGKDVQIGAKRIAFLSDNCDAIEEKGYMKRFNKDQLDSFKENLSEVAIEINDIEEEKKAVMADFKIKLDPLNDDKKNLLKNIKSKAEYVRERCYKFIDQELERIREITPNIAIIEV